MPLIQTLAPAIEPVSLQDAKLHLNLDADLTAHDSMIATLIAAARRACERECGRSLVQQGWRLVLDAFPGPSLMGVPYGMPYSLPGHAVQLERGPVIRVDSITYTDMAGATQTMPATDYAVDLTGPVARITPRFGKIWPITLPQIGSAVIDYTAGYGPAATDVPAEAVQWIKLHLHDYYVHRGTVVTERGITVEPLPYADRLLDGIRVWSC